MLPSVNNASFAEDVAHLQELLATVREKKSHLECALSEATAKITASSNPVVTHSLSLLTVLG